MRVIKSIQGAAYIGPYTEFGWIPTLAVIAVGIILFIIVYKLILSKLKGPEEKRVPQKEEVPQVVIPSDSPKNEDGTVKLTFKKEEMEVAEEIVTPMSGRLMPIGEVPDPIFSEKMVGDGFAIEPDKGEIYSPVNGKVMQIYSNRDALTIKTDAGRDVILHIGINSSYLKGDGIIFSVKEGDRVEAGDRIGWIDLVNIKPLISSTISPIVFPDLKEYEHIVVKQTGMVRAKMKGIIVIQKEKI